MTHHIIIGPPTPETMQRGQALAEKWGLPLYSLSHLIERGETVPIATLIMDEGIDQYHHIETVYLESILKREPGVVLITEAVAARPENRELLKSCTPGVL